MKDTIVNMIFLVVSLWMACLQSMANAQGLQKCGYVTINTFTAICCEGLVYVRAGVKPSCCGHLAYDDFHYLCCDGKIHKRKSPGNTVKCCSKAVFDITEAACQNGQVVHKSQLAAVGSTCCAGDDGWTCCRREENCCTSVGSGSLEVPGFRPVCCHITSTTIKAQCCSSAAQKSGVIPECCNSQRVKPVCCNTADNTFTCCEATIGIPSCCSNIPAYEVATQRPTTRPQYAPVGYQSIQNCCDSLRPQEYCCKTTQTQIMQTQAGFYYSTQCCSPSCCEKNAYSTPCCRKIRISCCRVYSNEQRIECCNRPGLTPSCCPGQPGKTRWTASSQNSRLRKTYEYVDQPYNENETPTQIPSSYGALRWEQTPNSAPLSCCQSLHIESCCTSGLRRSGGHPLCCPAAKYGNNPHSEGTHKRDQYEYTRNTGGTSSQHHQPQWTKERDNLHDLLRSEELQTFKGKSKLSYRKQNLLGTRTVLCSDIPYDTSQFICCSGVLQVKLGQESACCGTKSFDQSTQKCCNGRVRYWCPVRYN